MGLTKIPNDEFRMTKETKMTNDELNVRIAFRVSGFGFLSSFVIRHSDLGQSIVFSDGV
jgi:hypothetical protein